jgi:hypothetical protein
MPVIERIVLVVVIPNDSRTVNVGIRVDFPA